MSDDTPRHIRASELRLRIPRRSSAGYFEFPKYWLKGATALVDPGTGETFDLAYVLSTLEQQGWDVHELRKGAPQTRENVARLPLPYGGQFTPGTPTRRDT
ncbi:MAG: hypothetical protein FJ029_07890 [Actinobacteria bacterium]|nr:hypothetical protein [Actinomycetota bacterium]